MVSLSLIFQSSWKKKPQYAERVNGLGVDMILVAGPPAEEHGGGAITLRYRGKKNDLCR